MRSGRVTRSPSTAATAAGTVSVNESSSVTEVVNTRLRLPVEENWPALVVRVRVKPSAGSTASSSGMTTMMKPLDWPAGSVQAPPAGSSAAEAGLAPWPANA